MPRGVRRSGAGALAAARGCADFSLERLRLHHSMYRDISLSIEMLDLEGRCMCRTTAMYATGGAAFGRPFDRAEAWRAMAPRHGRHGRHEPGGMGFGGGPGAFPFGPGGGFRRRSKARRGDVRTAVLLLLAEEPRNGYQLMQVLEERSGGAWRPSAGSIYPAIQQLEDEGLVRTEEVDGRKLLHLTEAGRRLVDERGEDQPAPWDEMAGDVSDDVRAIMKVMREAIGAVTQVVQSGSEAQRAEARRLLIGLRRDLYRLLADGGEDEPKGGA
jgi:DNA-binding PadR family transcriptional regulator